MVTDFVNLIDCSTANLTLFSELNPDIPTNFDRVASSRWFALRPGTICEETHWKPSNGVSISCNHGIDEGMVIFYKLSKARATLCIERIGIARAALYLCAKAKVAWRKWLLGT